MTASPNFQLRRWPAAILPLLSFGLGQAFLPLVGIQADEVFFSTAVLHNPSSTVFDTQVFHIQVPLMLLSYLGALKNWIYAYLVLDRTFLRRYSFACAANGSNDDLAFHLVSGKSARPNGGVGGRTVAGHRHCVSGDHMFRLGSGGAATSSGSSGGLQWPLWPCSRASRGRDAAPRIWDWP
jgi:hypothetical protein